MRRVQVFPRYSDMDTFGHVNNACYLTYFEEARVKYVDDLIGWDYGKTNEGIIVARVEIDYKTPANFRDELFVDMHCSHVGNKSFTIDYKLIRQKGASEEIVSMGKSVLVMFNYDEQKTIAIPDKWRSILNGELNNK